MALYGSGVPGVLSVVRDPGCGSIRVRGGPGPAVCRFVWLEDTGVKRETYIPDALCYSAEPDHYRDFCPDLPDHIYPAVAPGPKLSEQLAETRAEIEETLDSYGEGTDADVPEAYSDPAHFIIGRIPDLSGDDLHQPLS